MTTEPLARDFLAPVQDNPADTGADFGRWNRDARIVQIRYMALLTAALYLLYAAIEYRFVPLADGQYAQIVRGLLVCAILLIVGLLSFRPALHGLMRAILVAAPVVAVAGNLYLSALYQGFTLYAPEVYLVIIWTFTVSGLALRQATMAALVTTGMVLVYTIVGGPSDGMVYLHLLWVFSAFTFGLLTAFILERGYKEMFVQRRELERLATVDNLTGLWNRRQVHDLLERETLRADRDDHPLSVVMLDIDHFKHVNDSHGHIVGDTLLREFAQLLRDNVRAADIVGRFGGEEFMIVLPQTALNRARNAVEKLRQAIGEHDFAVDANQTASFGVTQYRPSEPLLQLIHRVDQALYRAKQTGRNRICTA